MSRNVREQRGMCSARCAQDLYLLRALVRCAALLFARAGLLFYTFQSNAAIKMKLVQKKNAFFNCEVIKDLGCFQRTAESVFTVSRSRRKD